MNRNVLKIIILANKITFVYIKKQLKMCCFDGRHIQLLNEPD